MRNKQIKCKDCKQNQEKTWEESHKCELCGWDICKSCFDKNSINVNCKDGDYVCKSCFHALKEKRKEIGVRQNEMQRL